MIGCSEAVERLWAYLDGDLDEVDQGRVEAHLAWCRRCCGELEFARVLQEKLAAATVPDLPAPVEHRLVAFLGELEGQA